MTRNGSIVICDRIQEGIIKILKTLALALLLVAFGTSFAHAAETTVNMKFVNDSGKEMPVAIHTATGGMNFTLSAGQTFTLPIKNPAGNDSAKHVTYITFGTSHWEGNSPTDSQYVSNGYSLTVRNQLINGQAELEGAVITKAENNTSDCTYPYTITGWDGEKCTVKLSLTCE